MTASDGDITTGDGDGAKMNLALELCAKLQAASGAGAGAGDPASNNANAREWRLIGQDRDGIQLLSWTSVSGGENITSIGIYSRERDSFETLHSFRTKLNVIQATVDAPRTVLAYVVKDIANDPIDSFDARRKFFYRAYVLPLKSANVSEPRPIMSKSSKQIMVQFLYKNCQTDIESSIESKLMVFHHTDSVKSYKLNLKRDGEEDDFSDTWTLNELSAPEIIVKSFSWAQWDPVHQVLYYIHYRLPAQSTIDIGSPVTEGNSTPTLSGLQFHEDMPHETVLNIPLNLPQLTTSGEESICGLYEDDAVPLRVHDCSLDLQIVSHPSGIVCICHHYLYQPAEDCSSLSKNEEHVHKLDEGVHFAYSITLLHHGYVTHCVIPNLAWPLAKSLRPTFTLYQEDYLLVHLPSLYTHMLDIGLNHEPCCHIVLPPNSSVQGDHLVTMLGKDENTVIDLMTLDILKLNITDSHLVDVFKSKTSVENKMSILHYFLIHKLNMDVVEDLITHVCTKPQEDIGTITSIFKEFLISGSYIATKSCLPSAALVLTRLLPLTSNTKPSTLKVGEIIVNVNQEELWNTSMMLLSPRQRIMPFRSDMWIRLWEHLSQTMIRFKHQQVREKLKMSLQCYQPEALSRCSTPLSPVGPPPASRRSGISALQSSQSCNPILLPFIEIDTCTASKQEHIISVNLREVSMHLLKHNSSVNTTGSVHSHNSQDGATHVHSVATRYAGAQLESSRTLCLIICKSLNAVSKLDEERGFTFIDNMNSEHRFILLKVLEYYYLAAETLAFPLPQGFSSFFTYLGYRTLSFTNFVQYVHRNIFELQIDFLKLVVTEAGDDKKAVLNSLRLAALGGKERGRRALVSCQHPSALLLRARDHAATILAGQSVHLTRPASSSHSVNNRRGLAAFPSADRLSPLDTFLDLLTAKASLNELDFNLLIDATILAESAN